jgi:DNA-binding NarL/FixJ family response regulator
MFKVYPSARSKENSVARFKTLIVEDNDTFRQLLVESLNARFPAMIIGEASAGQEVIPKVETFFPDLIFMDIKIPQENGLSLTCKIKADYPETVVIILTSFDLPEYREAAYTRGANYFLAKGSSSNEEILALVASILLDLGFDLQGIKK